MKVLCGVEVLLATKTVGQKCYQGPEKSSEGQSAIGYYWTELLLGSICVQHDLIFGWKFSQTVMYSLLGLLSCRLFRNFTDLVDFREGQGETW